MWEVQEYFSEEEGFEWDFIGCVEAWKERGEHSWYENSLGKGRGNRNDTFRDSEGDKCVLSASLHQVSGWTVELSTWSLPLKQAQPAWSGQRLDDK